MTDKLGLAIQAILRPSEVVKFVLETRTLSVLESDLAGGATRSIETRILAVVSHVNPTQNREQGCLFIFKPKVSRYSSFPVDYVVERTFPVFGDFAIIMAQPQRKATDLRPSSSVSPLDQPRTELALTIRPGHGPTTAESFSLVTHDIQGLRSVLAECRRIKAVSVTQEVSDASTAFSWLTPYLSRRVEPPILSPIPPDLRIITKPLHTRLSPASAGLPGDDASDIAAIREDWVRKRITEELVASCNETSSLRIRIGTFNVNGKLPSQDLSAWVRGRLDGPELIPPLKEISPLSLGEIPHNAAEHNPEDDRSARLNSAVISDDTFTAFSAVRTLSSSRVSAITESTSTSNLDTREGVPEDPTDPDLLVLAFQELDLSTEALLYSTKTVREDAWCMAAFAGLGEKAVLYERLASKQLVGMLLVIMVKKRMKDMFCDVKSASVGAGIMGMMGNKGATAIRLVFTPTLSSFASPVKPTVITFVNSHLAAFDEMYEKRNADFHDLSKRLIFDSGIPVVGPRVEGTGRPESVLLNVFQTDVLFWMVNLNYRIDLPDADVRNLLSPMPGLKEENLKVLQKFDQLNIAIQTHKAFEGFSELPMSHAPSYRFGPGIVTGQEEYDVKRKPAWTDRILHIASSVLTLRQLEYSSHPEITMSDHKPVTAEFEVHMPIINVTTYNSFVRRMWREIADIDDTEKTPKLQLGGTAVDFGSISYKHRVTRSLDIENVGRVPCAYRFVPIGPDAPVFPDWLFVDEMTGFLLPGQKSTISISAYVDNTAASRLNIGPTRLEDTLILHTLLGKDHFISITGVYVRTCFATSLQWLARLPGPIRALRTRNELLPEDHVITGAPKEIMRLIDWLISNATEVAGNFTMAGEDMLIQSIRECLDTGADFKFPFSDNKPRLARAFASTLLQFFEALPEPLMPPSLHSRCSRVTNKDEAFEVLSELPNISVNVWISVTAMLHYLCQQSSSEAITDYLVVTFSSVLLRDDTTLAATTSVIGKRNFLRYFIS